MKNIVVCILLMIFSNTVSAAVVQTKTGIITRLSAYDDYGAVTGKEGADIVAWFSTGVSGCEHGVYLTPAAPGYNSIASFLLAAYASKQNVKFQIYNDRKWKGTGYNVCQIDMIGFL